MCKILFLVQPWIIPVDADFRKVPRPPLYIGFFSAVHSCWQASRNGKTNLKNSWSAHKWYSRFSSHQKISFHHPEPGSGFKPVLRVSDEYTPWKAALIFFELSMVCSAISDNSLMTKNARLRTGSIWNVNVGKGRIPGSYLMVALDEVNTSKDLDANSFVIQSQ